MPAEAPEGREVPTASSLRGIASLYRDLWVTSRGKRLRLLLILLMLIGARLVKLAGPLLFALAVNALQRSGGQAVGTVSLLVLAIAGTAVGYLILYVPARTAERYLALECRRVFTDHIYGHLIRLPLSWHEKHHSGELAHRIRSSSEALFEFAQSQAFYVQAVVTVVGSVGALLFFAPIMGLVAVAGYAGIFAFLVGVDRTVISKMHLQNEAEAGFSAAVTDNTGNVATVLTLGLQERTRAVLGERLTKVIQARRVVIRLQQRKWAFVEAANDGMWCVLVAGVAWSQWIYKEMIEVGTIVLVSQYAREITSAVMSMANNWQQLLGFATEHATAAPIRRAAVERSPDLALPPSWREASIEGLTYHYPDIQGDGKPAGLHDVSLVLRRGERMAVVGGSGAGKSTLLRLLAGVHTADAGRVIIDGAEIAGARGLRADATLVPQEAEIFNTTIQYNLTLGVDFPQSAIREVCRIAQLGAVIADLPEGLETNLAERGINLSGGQRQRVALARGLLAARGRPLLLLDEPTSSLDTATELDVYERIFTAYADACVVSSVHRLHLLPRFDRVILMVGGRVLDCGTHTELLARQATFRGLWKRTHEGVALLHERASHT